MEATTQVSGKSEGPHQRPRHQLGFETGALVRAKTRENLGIPVHTFYEAGEHGTKTIIIVMKIKKGVLR